MKLALIDLDVIESTRNAIMKSEIFSSVYIDGFRQALNFCMEKEIASQPALIELLRNAWDGGYAEHNTGEWEPFKPTFAEFLTQNNLTDETAQ